MIPKIIHYCWFGEGKMTALELKCLSSWKKHCPDFEIKLWNEENFDVNFCEFSKKAFEEKEYAFVSDVARIFALFSEGGIYMDTDMLLLQSFPANFFDLDFLIGKENKRLYSAGIIVATKWNDILKDLLICYQNKEFVKAEKSLIPVIITDELEKNHTLNFYKYLSPDYFYPLPYQYRNFHYNKFLTKNTIGVHLWNLSWKKSPYISPLNNFLRFVKYWISYFYIPNSFKKFRDNSFY